MITSVEQVLQSLDDIKDFIDRHYWFPKEAYKTAKPEPAKPEPVKPKPEPVKPTNSESEFEQLKALLASAEWPLAAPEALLCSDSETDKFERAEAILDFATGDIKDKKFLDFGCGLGHVAVKASQLGAKVAVGYDVASSSSFEWEKEEKYLLTTNFDKIKELMPFDLIILYDVLDHVKNPIGVLKQVKQLCNKDTEIFVRCHPFLSRHGGHLYNKINKAYVHLIFTPDELKSMGCECDYIQRVEQPFPYRNWLQEAGFAIVVEDRIEDVVEDFFLKNTLVASRMPKPPSIIGVWLHQGKHRVVFYPNGKLHDTNSDCTWKLDGLNLTLYQPDKRAPGGAWIDSVVLTPDMKRYRGNNQNGNSVWGEKIEEINNSSFVDFFLKTK